MGEVIDIFGDVDTAWEAYVAKARELETNPGLMMDRPFNEELARLHERWRKLFLRSEARP